MQSAHYAVAVSNELLELRYTHAHKRYYLHLSDVSYALTDECASAVYSACVRSAYRRRTSQSMRDNIYTLRSDIRSIVRENECAKFAH